MNNLIRLFISRLHAANCSFGARVYSHLVEEFDGTGSMIIHVSSQWRMEDMGAAQSKKRHERYFLDCFLNHQGITPTLIEERECPDFLLHFDGRVIGIEMTYLHIRDASENPLPQAVESVTDRIVSACLLYTSDAADE